MTIDLIRLKDREKVIMASNGWVFGPIFESKEQAESFIEWIKDNGPELQSQATKNFSLLSGRKDPRLYDDGELNELWQRWRMQQI